MKQTVKTLQEKKNRGEKITMLTAYDYTTACILDEAGIDTVLIGDSLGMTVLGYEDTLSVTMEDMIHHTRAVARGAQNALVVADMPFMSYQVSVEEAVMNAGRLMKEGRAQAVKLEGGAAVADRIRAITDIGIPVVAHLGMTPQSCNAFGGFKVQGKDRENAQRIVDDARAIQDAGAFMVVLECIPALLAKKITESLTIPTIGIGAGADCDGQVLVYQDACGMTQGFTPRFSRVFGEIGKGIKEAFAAYKEAVEKGDFPTAEHSFKMDEEIVKELR